MILIEEIMLIFVMICTTLPEKTLLTICPRSLAVGQTSHFVHPFCLPLRPIELGIL
jgi:hypothetical protein